jgi:hypothetical protein
MTLSSKWTAVSFLALTAIAAGSFAFAGCTATSGNPTDTEGGTGNPVVDSGTKTDSAAATCEGNMQTSGDFQSPQCQALLNANCCAELKGCFNLVVAAADGGADDNCDTYVKCVDDAQSKATQADKEAAQALCDLSAPQNVQDAYDAIVKCASDTDGGLTLCQ